MQAKPSAEHFRLVYRRRESTTTTTMHRRGATLCASMQKNSKRPNARFQHGPTKTSCVQQQDSKQGAWCVVKAIKPLATVSVKISDLQGHFPQPQANERYASGLSGHSKVRDYDQQHAEKSVQACMSLKDQRRIAYPCKSLITARLQRRGNSAKTLGHHVQSASFESA